jgi:hypothetical protein
MPFNSVPGHIRVALTDLPIRRLLVRIDDIPLDTLDRRLLLGMVVLTHGEDVPRQTLARLIEKQFGAESNLAANGEVIEL